METKLKINGIHCKSCKTLIEEEIKSISGVKNIEVDHLSGETTLNFEGDIKKIHKTIENLGYSVDQQSSLSDSNTSKNESKKNIQLAGMIFVFIALAYFIIQKLELFSLMSKLNEASVSYGIIFAIGILASFHCIGMCGGLVITYSSASAVPNEEKKPNLNPHIKYNLGRLISYTIIGGILGGFGSFFGINPNFSGLIVILAAIFMILMGASLFSEHRLLEKIKLRTPEFIAKIIYRNKKTNKPKGPLIIGLLTGFMPCGPLQAMQLFALSSGSIFNGAMAMFLYSLGTIPLMFGFGNLLTLIKGTDTKKIMKFSGVLVIVLGIFMFNRGLANFGYGMTGLIPSENKSQTEFLVNGEIKEYQTVEMAVTYSGYSPNVIYLKKDVPVRWIISDQGVTGCTNEIFLYHENGTIKQKLNQKETIIEFTPTKLGELKFSCWMKMVWGKFIVTDDGNQSGNIIKEEITPPTEQGGCNGSCGGSGGTCGGACGGGCGARIKSGQ